MAVAQSYWANGNLFLIRVKQVDVDRDQTPVTRSQAAGSDPALFWARKPVHSFFGNGPHLRSICFSDEEGYAVKLTIGKVT